MRHLSVLNKRKNKRAVSILVSYVILISITLSLSVLVYNWLKFYVIDSKVPECSENVKIIISDYDCFRSVRDQNTGQWIPGNLQIKLKNKGLFNVSGFSLRVHDREDAESGLYILDEDGVPLAPGEEFEKQYKFDEIIENQIGTQAIEKVTLVEVQPFIEEDGKVFCKSFATQRVEC